MIIVQTLFNLQRLQFLLTSTPDERLEKDCMLDCAAI